jgi:hypothetical protein
LSEAVICAEPLLVNDPAVAVKFAVAAPAVAVTDAGTETFALLEIKAINAPELGAGWLRVTTQVDIPFGLNEAGLQLKAET